MTVSYPEMLFTALVALVEKCAILSSLHCGWSIMADHKDSGEQHQIASARMASKHSFARNAVLIFSWATVLKENAFDVIYGMGQSMEPVIPDGSVILVDRLSRRWRDLERGDVVLLRSPTRSNGATICKRILALVRLLCIYVCVSVVFEAHLFAYMRGCYVGGGCRAAPAAV